MEYRRFGKTDKKVSVITLGGMRMKHGWDAPRDVIPADMIEEAEQVVQKAFDMGINLVETAYGYMKSEHAFGIILNDKLKKERSTYYLMTKGDAQTAQGMRNMVQDQLKALKTDYFDFYAWHGINSRELFEVACAKGGPVEELLKMKEEGIIKHIGFSTHANLDVIIDAINTDLFEFVNLHYYYFFQRNKAAVDLAQTKDMGVFIISPNDKGGKLYSPPQKLSDLTAPLTPLQWNARFCLSNSAIHTLTFGFPKIISFEQVPGIFPTRIPLTTDDAKIKHSLDGQTLNDEYADFDGYGMEYDPSNINIPEILRFRKLWKNYDMTEYCTYRYNMFKEVDVWFQGAFPTPEKLAQIDMSRCPENIPLKELLIETHAALYKPKEEKVEASSAANNAKKNLKIDLKDLKIANN